ncbi:hypothetical protein NI17_004525 [Thermobifida halotolerans]|uniref:ARB-07466-like C-terminal domain-containing protein n=1 Tax=Thermobifida halotolerans TaxID=483545 RepID=A0A399G1Z1_9ACTN|nr:hypothetical protein NI17_004525 [Thermobifida halotolerans]
MTLVVVALLVAGVLVGGPWLLRQAGVDETALPWGPDCTVLVDGERVGLDREEAMASTTAATRRADGGEAAVPDGVPPGAVTALVDGPADEPGPVLTCGSGSEDELDEEEMGESGLTPRAETLVEEMTEVHGELSLGGYAPGGISEGHGEDSTHYRGLAVDVFFRPVDEENRRAGWLLAQWLVAHAERLEVSVVIFDDRIWSTRFAAAGWRPYTSADPSNDILQHRDHVHVDVRRGT